MSYIGPQAATLGNVPGTAASVALFSATDHANGRVIYNDSSAVLYVAFAGTAATTTYTVQVASQGYFEFPVPVYAGTVTGIWASNAGTARTTSW